MTHHATDTYKMQIIALLRHDEAFANSEDWTNTRVRVCGHYSAAMRSEMRCTARERIYNSVQLKVDCDAKAYGKSYRSYTIDFPVMGSWCKGRKHVRGVLVAHIVDCHTKKPAALAWGCDDDVLRRVQWRSVTRVMTSLEDNLLQPLAIEAMARWLGYSTEVDVDTAAAVIALVSGAESSALTSSDPPC